MTRKNKHEHTRAQREPDTTMRVRFVNGDTAKIIRMDGKYIYTVNAQFRIKSAQIAEIYKQEPETEAPREVSADDADADLLEPVAETVYQEGQD